MKKRIARLVRLRERQRDQAAAQHSARQIEHQQAIDVLQQLTSRFDALDGEQVDIQSLAYLSQAAFAAEKEIGRRETHVRASKVALHKAAIALRRSEILEERARQEAATEQRRAEDRQTDEFAARRSNK